MASRLVEIEGHLRAFRDGQMAILGYAKYGFVGTCKPIRSRSA